MTAPGPGFSRRAVVALALAVCIAGVMGSLLTYKFATADSPSNELLIQVCGRTNDGRVAQLRLFNDLARDQEREGDLATAEQIRVNRDAFIAAFEDVALVSTKDPVRINCASVYK